ncbi:MAG: sulfotransferase family 2 domain-containing protein [bacterium]|nr:sulfotransferase family 2 domain-containing protein [bacterium]MDA1292312.1 sulfotransferase family 2 domain-containing protein [bacterium]
MDPQILIYMHMQKCGGTTLREVVERQFERPFHMNESIYRGGWRVIERFEAMEPFQQKIRQNLLQEHDVLMGHLPYGVHTMLSKPSVYITMLREPLDRVVSLYEYWKNSHLQTEIGDSLLEFLTTKVFGHALKDNHMVRVFNGTKGFQVRYGELTNDHLVTAIANMEKCAFVGLAEHFDTSLSILQDMFGWEDISYASRNVNAYRKTRSVYNDIPLDVQRAIEPRIALDRVLYDHACALFDTYTASVPSV